MASLLAQELKARRAINARYSLRAFARDLEISPGFLSHLLNGEKTLSADKAAQLAHRMGWDQRESKLLIDLSRYQSAQNPLNRKLIKKDLSEQKRSRTTFRRLKEDRFAAIADWYHLAILELIEVDGFSPNPCWIAHRLKISVTEATLALDRLARLKLISRGADGSLTKLVNNRVHDVPSTAIRKFHVQQLRKAQDAIEHAPFETRHASGITFAIDPDDLAEAFELVQEFRKKMARHFAKGKKKTVYHFALQLYPLDKGPLEKDPLEKGPLERGTLTTGLRNGGRRHA